MLLILALISFILGIIIGTQLSLLIQLIIFVIGILYLNSKSVAQMEIGAILPYMLITVLYAGIIVGDLSYAVQSQAWEGMNIHNPFVVNK